MLEQLSLEKFIELSQQNDRVVVSREIYGDLLTPVGVFQTLTQNKFDAALLDSSDHSTAADACIYMGLYPVAEFRSIKNQIEITTPDNCKKFIGEPLTELRKFYNRFKCSSVPTLAKFAGGMIGFLSYDAIRLFEYIPDRHANENQVPDICFKFYGTHVVFDKRSGKVIIAKVVNIEKKPEDCYQRTMLEIDAMITKIMVGRSINSQMKKLKTEPEYDVEIDVDDEGYMKMVEKARNYIAQGNAFQIVPSRRFRKKYTGDDFNIYRALRVLNPSPYQFYMRNKEFTIVGSSPERLVSLQQGIVEAMPIAGTRRRGKTYDEDVALEQELLNDEKERAEHMMLIDLGRNDLGSICEPGSVVVVDKAKIQRYSRVMHIVSRIQGKLCDGCDAFDVIKAAFPAGTLSGAPKIRAMEIIDEIETSRRGIYGGAIIAIDNEGQMDSCITIRTAFIKEGMATVRAGGGVVIDSVPQSEANETRHKAQAVLDALTLAQRGFV